ncbi:hypothetical protein E0D97_01895 [Oricola cellulosilytica]|uniref:Flagellar assembly protein FliH/Type III secretion system HrpE domain-containing protein n=1 Tax=Oricola cellulosilytica TaxID=1429082 RepID=A0A4R0PL19_9HYPH|nr:hypothetical protein E0D97_01895 [Oricola cellulosilytica]
MGISIIGHDVDHHLPGDEEPPAGSPLTEKDDSGGAALVGPADKDGSADETAAAARDGVTSSHAAVVEEMENSHNSAVSRLVSSSIPKLREEIVQSISDELAALIAGHIRAAIAERMLTAITKEIRGLLSDGAAISFELRGPEALIATFREQWSEEGVEIRTVLAESVDLVARVDQAVLATRLAEVDRLLQECAA